MMTATIQASASIERLVTEMLARGCAIQVVGPGMVRVISGRCTQKELEALQAQHQEVRGLLLNASVAAPSEEIEETNVQLALEAWKQPCTGGRGYDWSLRNWLTDLYGAELEGVIHGHATGERSMGEVHEAFRLYSEAHKTNYLVTVNRVKRQTVTPQVQPQHSDFARMLKLLGMTESEYLDAVRPIT